jgi:hypothetical protein
MFQKVGGLPVFLEDVIGRHPLGAVELQLGQSTLTRVHDKDGCQQGYEFDHGRPLPSRFTVYTLVTTIFSQLSGTRPERDQKKSIRLVRSLGG